jgi:hypothetical protein
LNPQTYGFDPLYHKSENFRINEKHISITPPSFMKFCPVVPEICRGQVHGARKERRIMIIIIRNGAKTISLQTLFGRFNNYLQGSENGRVVTIVYPISVNA